MSSENGAVYVQTNDGERNEIVTYRRDAGGRLEPARRVATGGRGSGKAHLQSQGSVVVQGRWILVVNAGSDDVSVIATDALTLVDRVASGGSTPTSIAVYGSRVYVLNAGADANVVGFRIGEDGRLVRVADATHSVGEGSDPAQVAFSPDGRTLVVTEAAGAQVGKASASSYELAGVSELRALAGPIGNTRSEVCWAVVSSDGRYAFVTNFGDGTVSTYSIADDGRIELHAAVAATTVDGQPGLRDEALSSNGRFLYALHADSRRVFGWRVGADGTLDPVGSIDGLPATTAGLVAV